MTGNRIYFAKLIISSTSTRGEAQPVFFIKTEGGEYGIFGSPCTKSFYRVPTDVPTDDVEYLRLQLTEMGIIPLNIQDFERSPISQLVKFISEVKANSGSTNSLLDNLIPQEHMDYLLKLFGHSLETAFRYS